MSHSTYQDDSDVTEITIQTDGRLFVFGLSEEVNNLLRLFQQERADMEAARLNQDVSFSIEVPSEK